MTSLTHKRVNNGKMRAQMRKLISDLKSQANSEQNESNLFLRVSAPLRGKMYAKRQLGRNYLLNFRNWLAALYI